MMKNILNEKSGASGPVETILLFSISFISLGLILMTFQSLNDRQTEVVMQEELIAIGNNIAKNMEDIAIEERASTGMGSSIKAELNLPGWAAGNLYSVKLTTGKIILESLTGPHVTVEVPMNTDIVVAENSTIYSTDEILELQYDSRSSTVFFTNGGVEPVLDTSPPNITIVSPPASPAINNTVTITVSVSDNKGVTQVDYYLNGALNYSATTSPYSWVWNTKTVSNEPYFMEARAYDAAGNYNTTSITYNVSNSATDPPVITIVSPINDTNFTRPIINVTISDDVGIDFSTLIMTIDGTPVNDTEIVHTNGNPSIVTYAVPANMNTGSYSVNVSVNDVDPILINSNSTSWSFSIIPVTDIFNPTASITSTGSNLVPGTTIAVEYSASDPAGDSGLDNFTITVNRNDGWNTSWYHEVSSYPDNILSTSSGQYSFTGNDYVNGYTYNFTIKAYDRSGKSNTSTAGPFLVSSGQSSQLEVITSGVTISNGGKTLDIIQFRDNASDSIVVSITDVKVSWSSGAQIKTVILDGTNYWRGSNPNPTGSPSGDQNSGTKLVFAGSYTASNVLKNMKLEFSGSVATNNITIIFYLSDSTTRTITFTAPP